MYFIQGTIQMELFNFKIWFDRSREKLFGEWYLLTKCIVHVKNHWEIVFAEQQIYCA